MQESTGEDAPKVGVWGQLKFQPLGTWPRTEGRREDICLEFGLEQTQESKIKVGHGGLPEALRGVPASQIVVQALDWTTRTDWQRDWAW